MFFMNMKYQIMPACYLLWTQKNQKKAHFLEENPALLNHPNYKTIINNIIRFSVIDDNKNKDSTIYSQILDNFNNKIAIQEEIVNLEVINNIFGWKINNWLNSLKHDLMFLKQKEVDMETLLTLELNAEKDELIEVVLSEMRVHTNLFQAELNKNKKDIQKN